VFLSMTATLISFGLLGFSSVAFVRSIGITVALGVAFTFLIAVAARPRTHERTWLNNSAEAPSRSSGSLLSRLWRRVRPFDASHTKLHTAGASRARRADGLATPRKSFTPPTDARAMTMRTAIQLDAAGLKVVGVTATGQRLFTVGWDGQIRDR
jgi:hypothetical protein